MNKQALFCDGTARYVCPLEPEVGETVTPVSYTHLDVYKRQPDNSGDNEERRSKRIV